MTIMTGAWQTIIDYKLVPLHTQPSMCSSWCSKSLSTCPSQSTSCMGCWWYTEMALIICYRMVQYLPALLVHTACAKVCPLQSMDSSILLGLASLCTSVYLPVEMTNMLIRSTGTYGDLPNNITNSTRLLCNLEPSLWAKLRLHPSISLLLLADSLTKTNHTYQYQISGACQSKETTLFLRYFMPLFHQI